jgi:hypothetical protein
MLMAKAAVSKSASKVGQINQSVGADNDIKQGRYIRIQLSLRPEYAQRLEWLRRALGVNSYAEVVREALRKTEQLAKIVGPQDKLYVEKPNGERTYIMQ